MKARPKESAELRCLLALRDARASYVRDILSHARKHLATQTKSAQELGPAQIKNLTSEAAYQVAEFYYLAKEYNLADRKKIELYLRSHNEAMTQYISNKRKRELAGVTVAEAEKGRFSEAQIGKVVENVIENKLRLDQSDLGRILTSVFAIETTRQAVIALWKGGLINRVRVGQVTLVVSSGILEAYFHKHLSLVARSVWNAK